MMDDRRQTIDTADGAYIPPSRPHPRNRDDASEGQYSTTTANTLAEFLVGPQHQIERSHDIMSPEKVSRLRRQKEEASAAINALNQFIFVAGHTFKGRQLNRTDQKRLREAAEQVGLSSEVVDTLVEQTSNQNAVFKYCMASDDAFARKMKNDPQLSRLLQEGVKDDGSGFDVAASVWRVFMHKIIQQFLKDHNMKLGDVMSKESLTARLYQEALRNEKLSADYAEATRIQRDYTQERQRLFISEEEAQLARQQAEARMDIPTHHSFLGLMPSDGEDYVMSHDNPIATDDILSLRPGVYPADDFSTRWSGAEAFDESRHSLRKSGVSRRQSAPLEMAKRRKPAASDGEEEVSAVKRGLAVFGKSLSQNREDAAKRQRRSSLEALEQSKLLKSRAKFEQGGNSENIGTEHPETRRPQRQSLAVLQESSVLNSRARFESSTLRGSDSEQAGTVRTRKSNGTPTVKKLNPNVSKMFEGKHSTGRIKELESNGRSPTDAVNRASAQDFVKSARQNFELSHNGEISEGESKPGRPTRAGISMPAEARGENQRDQRIFNTPTSNTRSQQQYGVVKDENEICDESIQNSGMGHPMYAGGKPNLIIVQRNSDDSNGVFSSLTQSSSSSQEENQSNSRRRSSRSRPMRHSRASGSLDSLGQSRIFDDPDDIDSMNRPVSSMPHDSREMGYAVNRNTHHQFSENRIRGPQHEHTRESPAPFSTESGELFSETSSLPLHEQPAQRPKERYSNVEDKGWIDFGSSFPGSRQHDSTEGQRGRFESDNEAATQPNIRRLSPPTRMLNEKQHKENSARAFTKSHKTASQVVEAWNRKAAKTLLSDEEQPAVPGMNRMKQKQASQSIPKQGKYRMMADSTSNGNMENSTSADQSGQWTDFQDNPFATDETQEVKAETRMPPKASHASIVGYRIERVGVEQSDVPNPLSTSTNDDSTQDRVSGHFRNVRASRSYKKSKHSLRYTQAATTNKNETYHTESNLIVWSADVDTSAEQNVHQIREAFRPKDIGGSIRSGSSKRRPKNIDKAFRRVNDIEQESFDGGLSGLYGQTETTRSMSSESDFDAVNAYHDSDIRRIENIQASEHTRILENSLPHPNREQVPYPGSPRQPDAPLVSHRGSRVSDVIGVVSRSRSPINIVGESWTGSSSSHIGLNSFPMSTATSNLGSMIHEEECMENLEDQQQAMVNCQVEPHKDCEMDPNKACTVAGVRLMEASYQPMNGGPPTLTPVGGSPSRRIHKEMKDSGPHRVRQRMPTPHYGNEELKEDDYKTLNSFLDSYSYESKKGRSSVLPHTPTGLAPPHFQSNPTPKARPYSSSMPTQRQDDVVVNNSSETLSDIMMDNTATHSEGEDEDEEARDDTNCRSNLSNYDSRDRYLDVEPGFDETSEGPTSPTQLRSADSESTVDEEDIRRAAERRGISSDVVDVLLSQTNSKIRRAPLKGVEALTPTNDLHSHEAPIDSDTCRPASLRHLRKDVGPDCDPIYEQGASWGEIAEGNQGRPYQCHSPRAPPPPPPPPPDPQEILAALQESADRSADENRRASLVSGMPELPEGASEEQVNLLNRFIEVAASNFDGKKLSAESEKRVREAAEKVGLSQKFVDQLLEQANANNSAARNKEAAKGHVPMHAVGVPDYSMDDELDEETTYYTNDQTTQVTKPRPKKRRTHQDVGCNAWEQLDYLKNLVRGWTSCGTPGDVHHEDEEDDDDDSSISSDGYRDELTRKLRKAQRKNKKGRKSRPPPETRTPQRGFV